MITVFLSSLFAIAFVLLIYGTVLEFKNSRLLKEEHKLVISKAKSEFQFKSLIVLAPLIIPISIYILFIDFFMFSNWSYILVFTCVIGVIVSTEYSLRKHFKSLRIAGISQSFIQKHRISYRLQNLPICIALALSASMIMAI